MRDVYHFFLKVSWPKLLVIFLMVYGGLNALFASLYAVDDQAISHARPGSWTDAFFFSVQTLATIGYGNMAPQSLYAHILVSIEALVGVMSFAIATGLMFAKFSRPNARVLFSDVAVISKRDGTPCLMFRMANERASHIVDAQLKVVMTASEVTLEGEKMRRLRDLRLQRQHSPLFSLTWTAVHPMDERSPLFGTSAEQLERSQVEIIASFVGIDELTLQTVHARHSFVGSEIRFDHRFADVLRTDETGQRFIDYRTFHHTHPVET